MKQIKEILSKVLLLRLLRQQTPRTLHELLIQKKKNCRCGVGYYFLYAHNSVIIKCLCYLYDNYRI